MEQDQPRFPHDQDNRIRYLYYDVNIHTIFNRTKLKNLKNKFCKYLNYIKKDRKNNIIQIFELQQLQDDAYDKWQRAKRISLIHNPTPENEEKRKALFPIFRKAEEECGKLKIISVGHTVSIEYIYNIINEINKQQHNIYKNYKKCSHCEKKDIVNLWL
jgi:hypothetical protein